MVARTTPEDILFGERLKYARIKAKKSQSKLAEEVGLTFQQIQKYEKGLNRISASRLLEFAKILNVSIDYFFRRDDIFSSNSKLAEDAIKNFKHEIDLNSENETLYKKLKDQSSSKNEKEENKIMSDFYEKTLLDLFRKIKKADTKEKIINLIKTITEIDNK